MEDKEKNKGVTPKKKASAKKSIKKKKQPVKGAGDVVEKLTKFLGVKYLIGQCEGCEKRKQALNEKFPNLKAFNMTEEQKRTWEQIKAEGIKPDKVSGSVNRSVAVLYNDVFKPSPRVDPINCGNCYGKFVNRCNQLDKVYYNETAK